MVRHPAQQAAHYILIARFTDVGRAQIQCLGPQFVIGQPMGSHDAKAGEFTMQTLDFARARCFQIQHHRLGLMPGNCGADFLVRASQMNGIKMLG